MHWVRIRSDVYYQLPEGLTDCSQVPIGERFNVAYLADRELVQFEVHMHQYPKVDDKPERYYHRTKARLMTDDEIADLRGT